MPMGMNGREFSEIPKLRMGASEHLIEILAIHAICNHSHPFANLPSVLARPEK